MNTQPHIIEQFEGDIWRLEIDELSDTIFVEIRNSAEKQVSFSAINLVNGEVYFKNFTTPERWLTGIEAAFDGVLLLHNYQSETGPAHKGLLAIDALSSKTLWSNYTLGFDHLTVDGPVLYDAHFHPRQLFLADIKTGTTKRVYEPSVYRILKNSVVIPKIASAEVVVDLLLIHPFGERVHYLEYNNLRIVSLHTLKAGALTQSIFIIDGVNKIYEDLINSGIQKLQPEAFIMHKNRLIYIKNRSELKVLAL
ncbi:MAG TPA: DUF4905 domain-containing protein [Mucilaginibacter sp.]|jgi:hypothetical protein|nr:DUF4905 domain-containing protein [Mucilaginibacter sp.]